MKVLDVSFQFEGTPAQLADTAAAAAPQFAAIPGCLRKTWLVDVENSRCGGVYVFATDHDLDAYLASDLWSAVQNDDGFTEFVVNSYDVLEEATSITGGLPSTLSAG